MIAIETETETMSAARANRDDRLEWQPGSGTDSIPAGGMIKSR
jgi:hypothetical protein